MFIVFIVRQVIEKAIEYNMTPYLCFIDMTKAVDRIHLMDVEDGNKTRRLSQPFAFNLLMDTIIDSVRRVKHDVYELLMYLIINVN